MKSKTTWKPLGHSAKKWRQMPPQRGSAEVFIPFRPGKKSPFRPGPAGKKS